MANELIINASLPETRIALMENGEIQELLIERASGKGIVGNIYKGRVTRVLPGMQAAFVDIGLEKAAFLYVDDVYVHSEIWEEEEGNHSAETTLADVQSDPEHLVEAPSRSPALELDEKSQREDLSGSPVVSPVRVKAQIVRPLGETVSEVLPSLETHLPKEETSGWEHEAVPQLGDPRLRLEEDADDEDDEDEEEDEDENSAEMGPAPGDGAGGEGSGDQPEGTLRPEHVKSEESELNSTAGNSEETGDGEEAETDAEGAQSGKKRHRRGRRGGRFRRRGPPPTVETPAGPAVNTQSPPTYPENYHEQLADQGDLDSDRSGLTEEALPPQDLTEGSEGRPENIPREANPRLPTPIQNPDRSEFKSQRSRDRRIRQKTSSRPIRAQVNIQDLLKEGQEVLVQVAKDPIATKGARLTCHISLPGRHLVCMPTIDHVGVSRRIEREEERRRLREYVERNRPRNLGFIVRTASGKQQSERRIKQDIEYLTRLWTEIREKSGSLTAPALVYEDLNSVLRAIRDWVTEEIDKVVVDSRYHFNEIHRFVSHFMPPLKQKIELYHGDIPIFDAYGLSTELSRALERKVWLKSGGYIVIDQAEALVAIDVNTGRYVGKKNLEDTILKTNLEAVQEIAYQLRVRNCGGIIILDLIDMEKDENKHRVYRALEDALMRDRARPSILKISELGLIEMTRKRTRDTIVRSLCESCTHCEGKGFIKSKQTVAYEVMREVEREGIEREVSKILVQAHSDVIDILAIDERETLDQLERRYRKMIYLQAVTDFHPEQFEVTADKKERTDRGRDYVKEGHSNSERPYEDRNKTRDRHHHRNEGVVTIQPISPVSEPVQIIVNSAHSSTEEAQKNDGLHHLPSLPQPITTLPVITPFQGQNHEGSYDEEDRLAFLRAQAAQDAALARLGSNPSSRSQNEAANRERGVPGRRPPRGRRGGGKFRRGTDRGGRAPKQFGFNSPGPKWNEPGKEGSHSAAPESTTETAATSGGEGGSGTGGGGGTTGGGAGGGEHSQPPV